MSPCSSLPRASGYLSTGHLRSGRPLGVWIGHGWPPSPSCAVALPASKLKNIEYYDKEEYHLCCLYAEEFQFCISRFVRSFAPGIKRDRFTNGAERRTTKVQAYPRIEAMVGAIQAVVHSKCFESEGWKRVDTLLGDGISSCLSATLVFINPVVELCVMHVKEHTDESRGPPSKPNGSIATYSTEPRATVWLVCVIGLASLLCSLHIPVW